MPGGICALANGPLIESAARCCEVTLSFGGVKQTIFLGGAAKALFRGMPEDRDLNPLDQIGVEWSDIYFFGSHPMLGDLEIRLGSLNSGALIGNSLINSIAPSPAIGIQGEFFPAMNRNELALEFRHIDSGVIYRSDELLVNSALITSIPPYESVYELETPVVYKATTESPVDTITVESCRVKLMELAHLNLKLEILSYDADNVKFQINFLNLTSEDEIEVTWFIWPIPEAGGIRGVTRLGRDLCSIAESAPKDIFYLERWIGVAVSSPFETKGAAAAIFPSLDL